MKVAILFEPDEDCIDPRDTHKRPRTHYELLEGDVLVLWRDQTNVDRAEGTDDIHFVGDGVFENVTLKQLRKIARKAGLLK